MHVEEHHSSAGENHVPRQANALKAEEPAWLAVLVPILEEWLVEEESTLHHRWSWHHVAHTAAWAAAVEEVAVDAAVGAERFEDGAPLDYVDLPVAVVVAAAAEN